MQNQTEHLVDKEEEAYMVKKIDQQISTTNGKNLKSQVLFNHLQMTQKW